MQRIVGYAIRRIGIANAPFYSVMRPSGSPAHLMTPRSFAGTKLVVNGRQVKLTDQNGILEVA